MAHIQIRNVPPELHRKLKAQAAREGLTLSEYMLRQARRTAEVPTLEEAVHADLLLHVLDVGHPHAEQQFKSVHGVLEEIGAKGKPEILLHGALAEQVEVAEAAARRAVEVHPGQRLLRPGRLPTAEKGKEYDPGNAGPHGRNPCDGWCASSARHVSKCKPPTLSV